MMRTDRLATANLEIRAAAAESHRARVLRHEARRGVEAIDAVLDQVEAYHLARRHRAVPMLPAWRRRLEVEGGLSIPRELRDLRNTVRLHEALLDWQEDLLDIRDDAA